MLIEATFQSTNSSSTWLINSSSKLLTDRPSSLVAKSCRAKNSINANMAVEASRARKEGAQRTRIASSWASKALGFNIFPRMIRFLSSVNQFSKSLTGKMSKEIDVNRCRARQDEGQYLRTINRCWILRHRFRRSSKSSKSAETTPKWISRALAKHQSWANSVSARKAPRILQARTTNWARNRGDPRARVIWMLIILEHIQSWSER